MCLVTKQEALDKANAFCVLERVNVIRCVRVQHVTNEMYEREIGTPYRNGKFLIEYEVADASGDETHVVPISVNDETGEAQFVHVM
jgi:hypothetical protein